MKLGRLPLRHPFWVLSSAGFYVFFLAVLAAHRSGNPQVLGLYSKRYAFLLFAYAAVFWPFIRLVWSCFESPKMQAPRGGVLTHACLWVLLLLLSLMPFEVYLRFHYRDLFKERRIEAYHPFLQIQPIRGDEALQLNADGFRGEAAALQKPEGVYRIIAMGGSTVFASDRPFEETHFGILKKLLEVRYPDKRIEVLNAGYEWYTSQQSLIRYMTYVKDYDPDMVVLWHGINDLYRSFTSKRFTYGPYRADYSHFYGPVANMVFHYFKPQPVLRLNLISLEYLIPRLWTRTLSKYVKQLEGVPMERFASLPAFERNMRSLVRNLKMDGVEVVLATQPFLYREGLSEKELRSIWMPRVMGTENKDFPDVVSVGNGMRRFNAATQAIAADENVAVVDLESKVPKTGEYFWDGCHYTGKTHAIMGQNLFEFIAGRGFLEKEPAVGAQGAVL